MQHFLSKIDINTRPHYFTHDNVQKMDIDDLSTYNKSAKVKEYVV